MRSARSNEFESVVTLAQSRRGEFGDLMDHPLRWTDPFRCHGGCSVESASVLTPRRRRSQAGSRVFV